MNDNNYTFQARMAKRKVEEIFNGLLLSVRELKRQKKEGK
jgi:hypothetical protein